MILFINPLNSFLTKSSKTAKLVYFGVQLIPTPESNKSLQVSGLYYSRLLSFIKYYIDEAITEMEAPSAVPNTEEIAEPYCSNSEPKIEALGVESVETPMTPQKPEIVNTEAVEAGETETDEVEDWPFSDDIELAVNTNSEMSIDEVILPQETEPTPEDMAANTFTGLATAPKLPTGSQDGSPPDWQASKLNDAVQTELDLKTEPTPELEEVEVVPTLLLEAIATEVKKVNPELCFTYDTNGKSVFLQVNHGDSKIGTFEDDGENLWTINCQAMTFHGFTEEQIDALAEIELSPKV